MPLNPNLLISPHFRLAEFVRSDTAKSRGIDNTPPDDAIIRLIALCCFTLEPLRRKWGRPLHINSGYRCPELNKAVGGVEMSQHMLGEAADIHCSGHAEAHALLECLIGCATFDQAIIEHNGKSTWLHVSCKFDSFANRYYINTNVLKE